MKILQYLNYFLYVLASGPRIVQAVSSAVASGPRIVKTVAVAGTGLQTQQPQVVKLVQTAQGAVVSPVGEVISN